MNVTGRIKKDVISFLFDKYFPHPFKCKDDLDAVVYTLSKPVSQKQEVETKNNRILDFFKREEKVVTLQVDTQKRYHCVEDMIGDTSFPHYDEIFETYQAISDLKHWFEVKSVAKRSESNEVYGDRNTLLALERIYNNVEYYKELDLVVDEILD